MISTRKNDLMLTNHVLTAHIIVTGDEVLCGDTTDTNGPFLARRFLDRGFLVDGITMMPDDRERLKALLRRLAGQVSVVVMTGGLGPTEDDHTRDAFAEAFKRPLVEDPEILQWMKERLENKGMSLERNRKQAHFPTDATILQNPVGAAPGFALEEGGTWFYTAPGVPRELTEMWSAKILPHLEEQYPGMREPLRASCWTFGKRESDLMEMLAPFRERHPEVDLGYRASLRGIQVKIRPSIGKDLSQKAFSETTAELRTALGSTYLADGETSVAEETHKLLLKHGLTLGVAESYTGGLVSDLLTNNAGSSAYLQASVVAYQAEIKRDLLGVPQELIDQHSVYSIEVVEAMAKGIRERSGADIGLATTGVAGPEPVSEERPVGWVAMGLALPDGSVVSRMNYLPGVREFVKRLGANASLYFLYRALRA